MGCSRYNYSESKLKATANLKLGHAHASAKHPTSVFYKIIFLWDHKINISPCDD